MRYFMLSFSFIAVFLIFSTNLHAQRKVIDTQRTIKEPSFIAVCKECPRGAKKGTELIKNGDFSSGNVNFTSSSTYKASGPLSDGQYSIRNSADLGNGQWAATDHTTGSARGLFFVSDGRGRSNGASWKQTVSVRKETKYVFCGFVNNLVKANKNYTDPRIEVRINNVPVVTQTIAESPDQWQVLSASWNAGNNTTATIEILTLATASVGNDWALDDLSFRACVPQEGVCHNCPRGSYPGFNLVTNGDFSSGNTDFSSALTYKANGLLSNGQYGVRNSADLVNGQWAATDHTTGSARGLFLACDGKGGSVSWKQKIEVDPKTTYSFCAFFNNLVKANKNYTDPIIEVYINGTRIIGPTALPEKPDLWVNMKAIWNSGSASSATIEIKTTATASVGNDYAVDDISLRPCN
ncbi:MAG: hypothetical protein R3E32_27910 [Chitinophagales bacterium]